eukprot:COSAG06_NODE_26033_length_623_cov_0.988550_1_plen_94_part_10
MRTAGGCWTHGVANVRRSSELCKLTVRIAARNQHSSTAAQRHGGDVRESSVAGFGVGSIFGGWLLERADGHRIMAAAAGATTAVNLVMAMASSF